MATQRAFDLNKIVHLRNAEKETGKVFESPEGSVVWIGKEETSKKMVLSQTLLHYKILWSRLTSSWTNVSKNKLDSLS